MDIRYHDMKFRRIIGMAFIRMAYVTMFGWLPSNLIIRISIGSDDTGELVIRHEDNVRIEPRHGL